MNTESQELAIQRHLSKGLPLTALDALKKFGCLRLSARIYDLRKRWKINGALVRVGNKMVSSYTMVKR